MSSTSHVLSLEELCFYPVILRAVMLFRQGRNERGQGGHNSPGAESLWGRWTIAGPPNDWGGAE